jgi:hypothetical protein
MRKYLIALIITETTLRFYFTLLRMATIKNTNKTKCWQGCGENGIYIHYLWECKLVQPLCKTIGRFLTKLKTEFPYDPAIQLLGIHMEECK